MGLGLAIVRNAVAVHGGSVTAKNIAPHGLDVELQLPTGATPPTARASGIQRLPQTTSKI